MSLRRGIIPPHMLRAVIESKANSDTAREAARTTLEFHERLVETRDKRFDAPGQLHGYNRGKPVDRSIRYLIPQDILDHIASSSDVDNATRASAQKNLEHLQQMLARASSQEEDDDGSPKETSYRAVYDVQHSSNEDDLPGKLVRAENEHTSADKAVNEAFDNVRTVLEFFKQHFKWKSIDNKNMDIISSVHFREAYENAFWDPQKRQMVFGDGDDFIHNFTGCIDVIGHELTHGVMEYVSPMVYEGQSGALAEHLADVFGIMVKQQVQDEKSDVADWLIGEDCILPDIKGTALRSMKNPGSAYDDPRIGKDPQVDHMSKLQNTSKDHGGVHVYSGIPNKAFYLASIAFGGYSWEKAGRIWWRTVSTHRIPPRCTFGQFALATIEVSEQELDEDAAEKVRKAWFDVGVATNVPKSSDWCTVL